MSQLKRFSFLQPASAGSFCIEKMKETTINKEFEQVIAHWERMIERVKNQSSQEYPYIWKTENAIRENWFGKYCLWRQKYFKKECRNCPLHKEADKNCKNSNSLWKKVYLSSTWEEWLDNAENFLAMIKEVQKIYKNKEVVKMEITVSFRLSEQGQKDAVLQGKDPQRNQTLVFSVKPTEEILSFCRPTEKGEFHLQTSQWDGWHITKKGEEKNTHFLFDTYPTSWEEIIKKCAERKRGKERYEKRNSQKKKQQENQEVEKVQWIAQYGSEELKWAMAEGYSVEKQYVLERAKKELERDVRVEYKRTGKWKKVDSPSLQAISLGRELKQKGYQSQTVWGYFCDCIKIFEEDDCYGHIRHEMVIIPNYLDGYDIDVIVWEEQEVKGTREYPNKPSNNNTFSFSVAQPGFTPPILEWR